MQYTCKTKITQEELRDALLLDKQVFGERSAVYQVCKFWLIKNDESFIIIKEKRFNKVVGYICFLPLVESVYQKYRDGKIHEYELRSKDILKYENGKSYNGLFCCIIIDEQHRDKTAIFELVEGFNKLIKSLNRRNIKIEKMVADCITKDGIKFVEREGYSYIKSYKGGKIYEKVL